MTRSEYVERVLSVMKHVTGEEREAIRAEIDAHIEDHICGLLELDYPEDLAEERTMALMGDPEEVGRELDKQYPAVWLIVKRAAVVLFLVVIWLVAADMWIITGNTVESLQARFCPETLATIEEYRDPLHVVEQTDLRAECAGVTLRVYQVGLLNATDSRSVAYLAMSGWNSEWYEERWPGDMAGLFLPHPLEIMSSSGQTPTQGWSGRWWEVCEVPVLYGDQITLTYDRYGEQFELTVDLPWKEREA